MLDGVAARIARVVGRIGRTVQVRAYAASGSSYDPVRVPTDTPAKAAIVDFSAHETDGSIVQADDKKAYLAASVTVTKQDKIIDGALEYSIVNLRQVKPGDEVFLYVAQLRA